MSKVGTRVSKLRKSLPHKVDHGNRMRTNIPSCMASPGPPLGPMLGQYGINISNFCKDFNEKTKHMKEGIPLPTKVLINPDRSYQITIHHPPTVYFLKQAAGISKGTMTGGSEVAGKITFKHLYEIAKIKSEDPPLQLFDLETVCKMVADTARSVGIEIVKELDPVEYQTFLEERKVYVDQKLKELQEAKEAKMLRTA